MLGQSEYGAGSLGERTGTRLQNGCVFVFAGAMLGHGEYGSGGRVTIAGAVRMGGGGNEKVES